jgi:hypothetical protein
MMQWSLHCLLATKPAPLLRTRTTKTEISNVDMTEAIPVVSTLNENIFDYIPPNSSVNILLCELFR